MRQTLKLAALAGLAVCSAAQAQLYQIVNSTAPVNGFIPNIDVAGNLIAGTPGTDDQAFLVAGGVPAAYQNDFLGSAAAYVNTNGTLWAANSGSLSNAPLTTSSNQGYYPMWDDLLTSTAANNGGIFVSDVGPGNVYVVQWNTRPFGTGSGAPTNPNIFKIQLQVYPAGRPDGVVAQYLYQGLGTISGQSATIGAVANAATPRAPYQWSNNTANSVTDNTVITVQALAAVGTCCFNDGTCAAGQTPAQCSAAGGAFNNAATCANANCPQPGSCCRSDGTCTFGLPATCTGVYTAGQTCANSNCPQPAACCRADGSCSTSLASACTAAGGTFNAGQTCGTFVCQNGYGVVCGATGTFTDITPSPTATAIMTATTDDGTVPFVTTVGNALFPNGATLYACSNGFISNVQTFATFTNGTLPQTVAGLNLGLFPDWDDLYVNADVGVVPPGSIMMDTQTEGGVQVQIIEWVSERMFANQTGPFGNFEVKIFAPPGGPGGALVQYVYQDMSFDLNGNSSTVGVQWSATAAMAAPGLNGNSNPNPGGPLANNSVCSIVGPPTGCYANCDGSTQAPVLNVQDFSCFLQKYAANDAYANCDGSTQPPVLNVQDFSCFLSKYAAGCQ